MKRIIVIVLVLTIGLVSVSKAKQNVALAASLENEMNIRMVLFIPADKNIPENYMERYKQIADYSEAFFEKWMNHWGYPVEDPLKIKRDANGFPEVIVVKGKLNYDNESYQKLEGIKKEVLAQAKNELNISVDKQVWWILNYPKRQRGSRGGGNAKKGGVCFANYMDAQGNIEVGEDLGGGLPEEILLKSLIHELTHALGLGHIGPRKERQLGNSLMGPINRAYKKQNINDNRVYLSEAAAAMLWKHPLFSGNKNDDLKIPSVKTENLKFEYNKEKNEVIIEGMLLSNEKAHSIVVLDASKGNKSPYWHKAYVGKVAKDGSFKCIVSELNKTDGELVLGFCFDNGAITGNERGLGLNSNGIKVDYKFLNGDCTFEN